MHPRRWIRSSALFSIAAAAASAATMAAAARNDGGPRDAKVVPLLSKEMADLPGKEGLMITVEYPPGGETAAHRHNAHVFVYVLEGSIEMQVKGGQRVTVNAGQTFYEAPTDIHAVSRNASKTRKAKFVVFLVKDKGAAPVLPAQ